MKQEMQVQVSSKEDNWITPPWIIERVKYVLGEIDLDPATSEQANTIVQANNILTIEDDALQHDWMFKNFFMNPPFGKVGTNSKAGIFCDYAIEQVENGNIRDGGIILTHDRTGYEWFNKLSKRFISVTLWDRVHFINPVTMQEAKASAKTAQTLFLINLDVREGVNYAKFIEAFNEIGRIYIP